MKYMHATIASRKDQIVGNSLWNTYGVACFSETIQSTLKTLLRIKSSVQGKIKKKEKKGKVPPWNWKEMP